jgi:thioredoxin 1
MLSPLSTTTADFVTSNDGVALINVTTSASISSDTAVLSPSSAVAVTDATFDTEVKNSDIPVVVDFWAEWCGPCKQIGPAFEELATELEGKVKIAKVDVDTNPSAAASMGVRGIPALFIFKDGEVVSNRAGAAPKAALQSWIEESI